MKESIKLLLENKDHRLKVLLVNVDIETHWSNMYKVESLSKKFGLQNFQVRVAPRKIISSLQFAVGRFFVPF